MRRTTKRRANNYHFKRRLEARYGLPIKRNDIRAMISMVRNAKTIFLSRLSNTRSLHKFIYKGKEIVAIYDKNQNNFITAVPNRSRNAHYSQRLKNS